MKFREALISAAEDANKEGLIDNRELFRIRLATLMRPIAVSRMEREMAKQAAFQGLLPASSADDLAAIDWSMLLSLLKELLPAILQIIALF